jgi:hypothetical protein
MLEDRHRAHVDTADFREGIAAYQIDPHVEKSKLNWKIPWPPELVGLYQKSILKGSVLAEAWQEVPAPFIIALNDTIRNRVLKFVLEIRDELGVVKDDLAALPPEQVDRTVINIIYGGRNVIAGRIDEVKQARTIVVVKGDLISLTDGLAELGVVDRADVEALQKAIEHDSVAQALPGLGERATDWIKATAFKLASKGGDAALAGC